MHLCIEHKLNLFREAKEGKFGSQRICGEVTAMHQYERLGSAIGGNHMNDDEITQTGEAIHRMLILAHCSHWPLSKGPD